MLFSLFHTDDPAVASMFYNCQKELIGLDRCPPVFSSILVNTAIYQDTLNVYYLHQGPKDHLPCPLPLGDNSSKVVSNSFQSHGL